MKKFILLFLTIATAVTLLGCKNNNQVLTKDYFDEIILDYNNKINKLTKENEEMNNKINELEENSDIVNEEIKALLLEQNEKIQHLETEIQKLIEFNNNDLTQIINDLKAQLIQMKEEYTQSIKDLDVRQEILKRELKELKAHLSLRENINLSISNTSNSLLKTAKYNHFENENLVIDEISFSLNHPLSDKILSTDVNVYERTISSPKSIIIDLEVEFHGYYELKLAVSYLFEGEKFDYVIIYQVFFDDIHYNLSWIPATMPVLLFATDLVYGKYNNGTTYVEIERAKTFNFNKLPDNSLKYPKSISASRGNYDQNEISGFYNNINFKSDNYLSQWIKELNYINEDSTFTIITIDRWQYLIPAITLIGVDFNKFNFKLYTDGRSSYTIINDNYKNLSDFSRLNNEIKQLINDNLNGLSENTYFDEKYMFSLTNMANFEFILNDISTIEFEQDLIDYLPELNLNEMSVEQAFIRLDSNQLSDLEYLLNTRWGNLPEESMAFYFSGSPTKNLLILGTSPSGENSQSSYLNFDNYIEHISKEYSDEYKVFYKGHPRYPSDTNRKNLFVENGITELPNNIPVEILMILYPEVYIGGYYSTSFLTSYQDQTIFFFGSKEFITDNAAIAGMFTNTSIFDNSLFFSKDENGDLKIEGQI